jgi:cleavage and polyadenylation specificity factor subunit 3
MMLEAQFGSEISPIEKPRVPVELAVGKTDGTDTIKEEDINEERVADIESAELDRLHAMGIPIPGLEIKVDKHIARVWLETLEVECANPVLRDRVRIVVERAVETVAGLWATSSMPREAVVPDGPGKGQIEMVTAMKKAQAIEA